MKRSEPVLAIVIFSLIAATGPAAEPRVQRSDNVRAALIAEANGKVDTRWQLLNTIANSDPANREARWQLGQVQFGKDWLDYTASANRISDQAAVQQYRDVRDNYPLTFRGQLDLANWCRRNHLPDRERAHLTAALERSENPNDPALRARLGFRRVNEAWLSEKDADRQQAAIEESRRNVRLWTGRIKRLARQSQSTKADVRDAAIAELKSINDPAAIPALEAVLPNGGLKSSELLVELLAAMKSNKAADALARLAVLSPWDAVRKDASRKLRVRPIESFAPELLATLRTPIKSRTGLFVIGRGVQLIQVATSETERTRQLSLGQSTTVFNTVGGTSDERGRLRRAAGNAATQAALKARTSERQFETLNTSIKEWNDRVCLVLADATGVVLPAEPSQWWEWWKDFNQLESEGSRNKPYEYRYYYETRVETVDLSEQVLLPQRPLTIAVTPTDSPRGRECLVAGTPVWTDRGFVAVEAIQIGDLVLSREPKSGKLSYEPVLRTTIRKAEPVMTVVTDRGTIRATGGHTFWISGQGWTKLRDAKPGDFFHGAAGPSKILRLKKDDGKEKTYNLVVSDVHTYFVGKGLVLSHDVTFAEPVDATVPGLPIDFSSATTERKSH